MPVMTVFAAPSLSEASRSDRPTPIRLVTLARIRTRSAKFLDRSSFAAWALVSSPFMRPTATHTHAMNTVAATFQPMSEAACHGARSIAMPNATNPAANDRRTRVGALLWELWRLLPRSFAVEPSTDATRYADPSREPPTIGDPRRTSVAARRTRPKARRP